MFSEPISRAEDVWGWVEPEGMINLVVFGYQAFPPLASGLPVTASFYFVDESIPELEFSESVPISTRTTGGRTGGWNADKSRFAVIRSQGSSPGPGIRDFLTYVDCSNPNSALWVLAPDIREVTSEGGDFTQQIRFVPPDGGSIGRIRFRNSPAGRVFDVVNITTGASVVRGYESFFPGFSGDVWRWAYSQDGQWAAFNLDGNAPSGDGCFIYRRSDNALMYHDPVGLNSESFYELHGFLEDSSAFAYMSGTTVKKVSTSTWTVVQSQAFPSEPRPQHISPSGLFYTGGTSAGGGGGRVWDTNFNLIYTVSDGIRMDWNLEGTRMWGAQGTRHYTITTPGAVATDVGLVTSGGEGGYRMRPWM